VIVAEGQGIWNEYAGGYSDMVAQRGYGVTAPPVPTKPIREAKAAAVPASSPPTRQKLSFKQKHALETLPKEIARLEGEIERLHATLADPGLYARDPAEFNRASKALDAAETALSEAENEWLRLETLREEIEG
jgi:ATP-binding cassette subfamily F protein uup